MIGARYPHRISVFHPTGTDSWNAPTGTTTTDVHALVEYRLQLIRTAAGEQKPSRALVETRHPVEAGDIVTLPGDLTGQQVLDVRRIGDLGGREMKREVYL